jgi:cell division GTPase FtsZ
MDKKTTLLGLGGAGCRILSEISRMPAISDLNFLAVDTDVASLAATGLPPECCIQAAKKWRNGARSDG